MWPPPQPEETFEAFFNDNAPGRRHGHRSHTFADPFFAHRPHHSYSNFAFRDPFELFSSIFRDFDEIFGPPSVPTFTPFHPFGSMHSQRSYSLFPDSLFVPSMPTIAFDPFPSGFEHSRGPRGQFYSESIMTSTVNGVTHTVHTRMDENVSNISIFSVPQYLITPSGE